MKPISQSLRKIADQIDGQGTIPQTEVEQIVAVLMKESPELLGTALDAISNQNERLADKITQMKAEIDQGTQVSIPLVNSMIQAFSRRYSSLLSQIGIVEDRLELLQNLREKAEANDNTFRFATLPMLLLIDLVKELKQSGWARLSWSEDVDLRCPDVTDYARLVDIRVEPNIAWDGLVTFSFVQKGYITERDYEVLCQKFRRLAPYYKAG